MTKVSVIVPVYNAEKAIERCIRSILDQEYQDIECIAVDDGSKDASGEILDRLAESDSRLKVIHKENGGVSKARNTALDVVNGEYVQFLDADDWIPTDSTKLLLRAMEENEADLAIGYFYRVVGENVAIQGSIDTTKALTLQEYAQFMMMGCRDWDGNYFKYNDDTKYRQLLNYYSQASYNNVIDEVNRIHSLFYLPEKKENESS